MKPSNKDALILVTGGTGLVGSYLIRYLLRQGYTRIRALCRAGSSFALLGDAQERVEWVKTDLLDVLGLEDALAGVRFVYHCAALISFDPAERELMLRINRDGTANIVNGCLYAGVEKLVHLSSIAAIGRDPKNAKVDENTKWQNSKDNSTYAISKFQGEQEVWRGQAEGLRVAVLNPSVILGGGFWHSGPQQVFGVVWRSYPFYPVGHTGFVDVRDVARFAILLMESEKDGERYLLNGDNASYQQVQNEIARILDRRPPRIALTPGRAALAARLEWLGSKLLGRAPLITRETAQLTTSSYTYLNDKSRRDLNFEYIPLSETIRETSELFREAAADNFPPKVLPLK